MDIKLCAVPAPKAKTKTVRSPGGVSCEVPIGWKDPNTEKKGPIEGCLTTASDPSVYLYVVLPLIIKGFIGELREYRNCHFK